MFLPIAISATRVGGHAPRRCFSHATIHDSDASRHATVRVFDTDGMPIVVFEEVRLRRVSRDTLARRDDRWLAPWLYRTVWRPQPKEGTAPASIPNRRRWVILPETGGLAQKLAARLDGAQLLPSESLRHGAPSPLALADATDVIDLRPLAAASGASAAAGVCLLAQSLLTGSAAPESRARLWVITAGGHSVSGTEVALSPTQAAPWGVVRTLQLEHPELQALGIDLDPESPEESLDTIIAQLENGGPQPEIAVRAGELWVSRLVRHRLEPAGSAAVEPCRWVPGTEGTFEQFVRQPLVRRQPGAGEVEIAIHATGLNLRDVLNVLGLYPGVKPPLGGECAGIVSAVGAGVAHLKVGQRVLAVAADTFASHVIAAAGNVRALPPGVRMDEAASFPIAYITAEYCLIEIGRLRAGEIVLVHAGAGGVGMAAVLTAQRLGAQVFATAGSSAKRELLRSLGVAQVFDSRSPAFADAVLLASDGRGVDLVLNSLAGDMRDASFRVVTRGGRFVEIGKLGIKTAAEVEAIGRDIAYTVVDWTDTSQTPPAVIESVLDRVVAGMSAGRITPLPRHVFSIDDAPKAFRLMAAGRHVGRIVLKHPIASVAGNVHAGMRRDGTYLVTGGMSGLGLVVARWLVESGAGRIVLVGRRGATEETASVIAQLRATGTTVLTVALDVSDEAALAALLIQLRREGPALRGVVHAAAVLENAAILKQSEGHFERAAAAKLGGAEALDRITRADPLDFLVFFSSVAAPLGAPGQANYAAANYALDAVAARRHRDGLPAVAISWGAWSQTGVASNARTTSWLTDKGLVAMTPAQGLRALERLLAENIAAVTVAPLDWPRYIERVLGGRTPDFLSELVGSRAGAGTAPALPGSQHAAVPSIRAQLDASPPAGRAAILQAFVRERVSHALGIDPSRKVDDRIPLGELGLDSLLAIELRNTLSAALRRPLPATFLFDHPSIAQLTAALLIDEEGITAAAGMPAVPTSPSMAAQLITEVAGLSDEEVELQLAARSKVRGGS
jgi:NADPH:quinone reductase-like Zn-dependent oxidoreductase